MAGSSNWTWQRVSSHDDWEFGEVVRGMIREPVGELYFDEELAPVGWVWMVMVPGNDARGRAHSRQEAARCVEEALGIIWVPSREAMSGTEEEAGFVKNSGMAEWHYHTPPEWVRLPAEPPSTKVIHDE